MKPFFSLVALFIAFSLSISGLSEPIALDHTEQELEAQEGVDDDRTDKEIRSELGKALSIIRGGDSYGGAELLQEKILSLPDRIIALDPKKPFEVTSTHQRTIDILGNLPPSGRQKYELNYGAIARAAFIEAAEKEDKKALYDVSTRYLYTEAGKDATALLAYLHQNEGNPQAAAMFFGRLLDREGMLSHAIDTATLLRAAISYRMSRDDDKVEEIFKAITARKKTDPPIMGGKTLSTEKAREIVDAAPQDKRFHKSNNLNWLVLKKAQDEGTQHPKLSMPVKNPISCLEDKESPIKDIAFSPTDPSKILTVNAKGEIFEWDQLSGTRRLIHRVSNTSWRTERFFKFLRNGRFLTWKAEDGLAVSRTSSFSKIRTAVRVSH